MLQYKGSFSLEARKPDRSSDVAFVENSKAVRVVLSSSPLSIALVTDAANVPKKKRRKPLSPGPERSCQRGRGESKIEAFNPRPLYGATAPQERRRQPRQSLYFKPANHRRRRRVHQRKRGQSRRVLLPNVRAAEKRRGLSVVLPTFEPLSPAAISEVLFLI